MTRHTVARAPLALVAAVVAVLAMALPATAQETTRLEDGLTPAARAVAWSQASFADGAAPDVLIARDDDFAEALTSGPLQGLLEAPLLLTNSTVLSPETAAEITRLGATNAIVLGGEVAVSETVVTMLEALGLTTERVFGDTRLTTATAIVERFFPNTTSVVLARAFGDDDPTQAFADSLTAGPYAAAANTPILLTSSEELDEPTATALTALPVDTVTIAGGEAAVSSAVAGQAAQAIDDGDDQTDEAVRRAGGDTRFETAIELNALLFYATGADAPRIILVEGQNEDSWTSGLPAGVQAGNGAATVLSNGPELPEETRAFIEGSGVPLICGPQVDEAACTAAEQAINGA
jgi:putative cell wall-binding protein